MTENAKKAPEGTQAVIRAVHLLKAFTHDRPEQTLAELSDALGLTKTTAHRLLTALESEGLVARNAVAKTFRLGPGILALGAQAMIGNDLRTIVEPELRALAEHTGETATLEVPVNGDMLILAEVAGRHLVNVSTELGTRWPLHATSTGRAYLAAHPGDEWRSLLPRRLEKRTPATIADMDRLAREIERIRERGYATASDELEEGAAAAGAALEDSLGNPVGGISLGGPSSRLTPDRLAELGRELVEVAKRLAPLLHRVE
jgi:IclR family acetate operon transcriptional repressor